MAITLDGTTGITTPGLTNTGSLSIVNFTTSGNTILGDASTDTLNVGNGGLVKDASGNVGIGTASPSGKLQVLGPNGTAENEYRSFTVSGSSGNKTVNIAYDAVNDIGVIAAADAGVNWKSLALCPVGGKVGINLSAPDSTLTVNGQFSVGAAPSGRRLYMGQNGTNTYIQALSSTSTAEGLAFFNGGTQTMTLNSSGNLGLGVTPSAWFNTVKALQFSTSGSLWAINGQQNVLLTNNTYLDSSAAYTYIATGFASNYQQIAGEHRWLTAPSGTAGNAITFTQAMTLSAAGNLGIGTTSTGGSATDRQLTVLGTTAQITTSNNTYSTNFGVNATNLSYLQATGATPNLALYTGSTERMRIDSSGNVGIGTASPAAKLDIYRTSVGTYFLGGSDNVGRQLAIKSSTTLNAGDTHTFDAQSGSGVLVFATTSTERMRITTIGTVVRSPQYTGNFSAGYTTVVDLTTIGAGLIIYGFANENGVVNTSTGIWLATASSYTGTYTLLLVSQATAGNAYGRLDMQMSGNNLQVKNGIGALGGYRLVFTAIA
jgi:hypothetical protein